MPRSQGFARGDIDTAFPLDDKMLALRGRLSPERYYAAVGVYFHVAAATWREAERKAAIKVCPDAGDLLDELRAVDLLDDEGCVSKRAFAHSVGRAKRQRRTASDRQSRNRAQKSRVTARDNGVTNGESQSRAGKDRDGSVGTVGTETGGSGGAEPDILDEFYRLTGRFPSGNTSDWLERLSNEFGHDAASHQLAAAFIADSSPRTLLSRTENELRAEQHAVGRKAEEAEVARLDQWNKTRKLTPEQIADNLRRRDEILRQWTEGKAS